MLDKAKQPEDLNAPGWRLHLLSGDLAGHYSIALNGNWRITFRFDESDAVKSVTSQANPMVRCGLHTFLEFF